MSRTRGLLLAMLVQACTGAAQAPAPVASSVPVPTASVASDDVQQLVVVTTPAWDSISGTMRRFTRVRPTLAWRADGAPVRVVVGRTGLAWGADTLGRGSRDPRKREGDGRAPAGMFPLETAFGFAPATAASWVRVPY